MIDFDSVVPSDEPISEEKQKFMQKIDTLKTRYDQSLKATGVPDGEHHHFWTHWQID